jgi:predicted AAA+ superfamily ATPase
MGAVRDDELRRLLTESNPWWRAAAAGGDPRQAVRGRRILRDRAQYDLGYRTRVLDDIAQAPVGDSLVLLTGPRRVGKSVAVLDLAEDLCAKPDVNPFQVIYLPCDGMIGRDVRRAFTLGRALTAAADATGRTPRLWLLDEVSAVQGWTAVIKSARDGTDVGDDTVVVTGSRWRPNEDVEGNLLAGRAGRSGLRRVRHLLPMSFRDFVLTTHPDLALPEPVHPADLQEPHVRAALEALRFDIDAYDLAWQDFLTCGGFPRAVAEHRRRGAVSEGYLRDLAAWLRDDINLDGPPQSLPLLLSELAARASSPLNVTNLARTLGWPRAATEGRLNRLVAAFAALWCRQHDSDGRAVPGSQPKLYLVDPVLSWLPYRLRSGIATPDMTRLTEQMIGVALARALDDMEEGRLLSGDTIGFARTDAGNEVDLSPVTAPAAGGDRRSVPIEGKWVDQGWRSEAKVIEGKYGAGVLATKSILDMDHPTWAVPAPLVALLLG